MNEGTLPDTKRYLEAEWGGLASINWGASLPRLNSESTAYWLRHFCRSLSFLSARLLTCKVAMVTIATQIYYEE